MKSTLTVLVACVTASVSLLGADARAAGPIPESAFAVLGREMVTTEDHAIIRASIGVHATGGPDYRVTLAAGTNVDANRLVVAGA